jgi:hypothetical protein
MDKPRHPHVVRTWTVERTRIPYRPPQPKIRPNQQPAGFRPPDRTPPKPAPERKDREQ